MILHMILALLFSVVPFPRQAIGPGPGFGVQPGAAPSGPAYVNSTYVNATGTAVTSVTTPSLSVTSGNLLHFYCRASHTAGVMTASSSPSETWNSLTPQVNGSGPESYGFYAVAANTGSHMVTCTLTSAGLASVWLGQYSDVSTKDVDTGSTTCTGTSCTSPTFSSTAKGVIIFCATNNSSSGQWSSGTIAGVGATERWTDGGGTNAVACEDIITTGAQSSVTAALTLSVTGTEWVDSVAAFK